MKKKPSFYVFLVRLVNFPGIVAVFTAYVLAMTARQRQNKEVVFYGTFLRGVLIGALPWVSDAIWTIVAAFVILKKILL